jgi:hypothetical protein
VGLARERIVGQVQILLRVQIFISVLYYHRTLLIATSIFLCVEGADQSGKPPPPKKKCLTVSRAISYGIRIGLTEKKVQYKKRQRPSAVVFTKCKTTRLSPIISQALNNIREKANINHPLNLCYHVPGNETMANEDKPRSVILIYTEGFLQCQFTCRTKIV